jgi:transaldolase/glucose-6-phosphate isomerase
VRWSLPDGLDPGELVERIWERDPTVWTGEDEASWLGWLDEPLRMRERAAELREAAGALDHSRVVVLGMGGSSLAPLVLGRLFGAPLEVLDTTHPAAIRRLDPEGVLFVVSSKSGTTIETRCHFDHLWEQTGRKAEHFVVITDPGSPLEELAKTRGVRVFAGEPTVGGRYSALTVFGLVPAALAGIDIGRLLEGAEAAIESCKRAADNPGLELGLQLGTGWREARDKVVVPNPGGVGLWLEQLLAESTGKEGKGLIPAPGESPEGSDRQWADVDLDDPSELGAEFFRWEFATAVAGSVLGINPFNQPNVQEAKDRTQAILDKGGDVKLEPEGGVEELLAQAKPGDYVAIQAFVDPAREEELEPLVQQARETGCVVTHGLGPRYLHSTGQLHKGGPPTGLFLQVVDDTGPEIPVPGRKLGFGRLIRAQAAGDYEALRERGRPVARVRLEEVVR